MPPKRSEAAGGKRKAAEEANGHIQGTWVVVENLCLDRPGPLDHGRLPYVRYISNAAAAAAAAPKKKKPNTRTLKAALSGECDVAALLRFLHDDVAEVRKQQAQEQQAQAQEQQPREEEGGEPDAAAAAAAKGDDDAPAASAGGSPPRKRAANAAGACVHVVGGGGCVLGQQGPMNGRSY